jgi:hypothetical protein
MALHGLVYPFRKMRWDLVRVDQIGVVFRPAALDREMTKPRHRSSPFWHRLRLWLRDRRLLIPSGFGQFPVTARRRHGREWTSKLGLWCGGGGREGLEMGRKESEGSVAARVKFEGGHGSVISLGKELEESRAG